MFKCLFNTFAKIIKLNKFIMRKVLLHLMAIAFTMSILNSCKKGSEDPFISLRSRESRLKGEWNLSAGTATIIDGATTTNKTFDGSMVTIITNGQSQTYAHTEKMEFLKDNVYKSTKLNDANLEICEGYWAFMDGYGDDVSDEQCVVLRYKSVIIGGNVQTYTADKMPINILNLKKLTNSEIITEFDGISVESGTVTTTILKTYEKK